MFAEKCLSFHDDFLFAFDCNCIKLFVDGSVFFAFVCFFSWTRKRAASSFS